MDRKRNFEKIALTQRVDNTNRRLDATNDRISQSHDDITQNVSNVFKELVTLIRSNQAETNRRFDDVDRRFNHLISNKQYRKSMWVSMATLIVGIISIIVAVVIALR